MSRRSLLGLFGAGAAGVAVGGLVGARVARPQAPPAQAPTSEDLTHPFDGPHQAGIVTPVQDQMHMAAFDMSPRATRGDLIELLQEWTHAARRLVVGGDVSAAGAFGGGPYFPPDDSGEAVDHGPAGLTLTFGFGRTLFTTDDGQDRFGLAAHAPAALDDVPVMTNDFIDRARSGGDLVVQACANDPQVAVHAIRNLTRIAVGTATIRWSQLGFGRSSATTADQPTPRNLFGQKDGTANLRAEDADLLDEHVWIPDDEGPAWAVGGSYLVARRISMTIEVWDSLQLTEQERVTGRDKPNGAPLSGGDEFATPDFAATDEAGNLLIDERSHVSRVHPAHNDGIRMLRRGFNFVDGNDEQGRLDAGLFFIAFVRDPARFAQVHRSMSRDDMFVEYLKTTSSSVFVVPPGVADGEYVGQALLEA
jgi:deferrochelatase/peroxidase EfeB